MKKVNSFFFSKIIHRKILNLSGSVVGRLNDFILDFNTDKPTIKALQIKNGRNISYVLPEFLEVYKDDQEGYEIKFNSNNIVFVSVSENDIFLLRDFLDKQIVDINGKKVERVNDARLGMINGQWTLVAVDIGTRGLLRRLGVEYPAIRVTEMLNMKFRNSLIYWDNVQPIAGGTENLRLSTSLTKIKTLHAADIADIIEELDNISRKVLFQSLDDKQAAEVLEEMEYKVQANLMETLSDEKVSDLLEIMPPDEAADILGHIDTNRAERLLVQMESENSEEIRELMEYHENTIGSLMSKEFLSFLPDISVKDVLSHLRQSGAQGDETHYVFLVNNKNRLLGSVTLLDLILSDGDRKLYDLALPNIYSLTDEEEIDKALELMQKYNLPYMPVVNGEKQLIGIVSLTDLVYELIQ